MSLVTGSVYLAGSLLTFALPVGLLICFATFFVRQARKNAPTAAGTAGSTPSTAAEPAAPAQSPTAPQTPPAPTGPYSDL